MGTVKTTFGEQLAYAAGVLGCMVQEVQFTRISDNHPALETLCEARKTKDLVSGFMGLEDLEWWVFDWQGRPTVLWTDGLTQATRPAGLGHSWVAWHQG